MPTTSEQQQLLSDEVQEIISYKPGWIIRRGNIVFCFVLLFLLGLSFVIKYPDVIKASVRIAALSGPKMLTAKTEGRLEKLFITNGQQVKKGQPLAYLQSTAQYDQVIQLKQWIIKAEPFIEAGKIDFLIAHPLPLLNELGELQPVYQNFQNSMQETMQVLSNGYYPQKKQALLKDIQYLQKLQQNLEKQSIIQQQDYALQQIEYNANEKLAGEKVIARLEFNQNKSKLLGKEQGLEQMSSQLINGEVAKHNKNKELLDLKKYITDQVQKFRSELLNLKSKTTEWTEKYIITAPDDGKLEFTSFIQEKQLLSNGQELFFIQPAGSKYYAEMKAGQNNLGKIEKGQKVLIHLESYPSEEFGYIDGVITYIANMPNARDSFLVRVELPEGLKTNYNKEIFFRNSLSASAEIIADDSRLIERFFSQLKNIMKR
jgi:multidrug resistance efflux pump